MSFRDALWLENIGPSYNAGEYRQLLKALCEDTSGVMRYGDLKVSQRGAGANMSVDVAVGSGYVVGSQSGNQGAYFVHNEGVINVPINASSGSNPRDDIIGVRIQDSEYSGATDATNAVSIAGSPAASPSDPATPDNFLRLARVRVGTSASSIVNANITELRQLSAPAKNARGRLANNEFNADTGTITALVPVSNSLTPFSVDTAGRRISLKAVLQWRGSQVDDAIEVHFRLDGANVHGAMSVPVQITAQDMTWEVSTDISPTAGSHTVDMTVVRASGGGLPRIQGVASYIRIYDEGGRIS